MLKTVLALIYGSGKKQLCVHIFVIKSLIMELIIVLYVTFIAEAKHNAVPNYFKLDYCDICSL